MPQPTPHPLLGKADAHGPPARTEAVRPPDAPPEDGPAWRRYCGVSKDPTGRWEAYAYSAKRKIYLGTWDSDFEAARAHDYAVISLHGKDSLVLNFPPRVYGDDLAVLEETSAADVIGRLREIAKSKRKRLGRNGLLGDSQAESTTNIRPGPAKPNKSRGKQAPRAAAQGAKRERTSQQKPQLAASASASRGACPHPEASEDDAPAPPPLKKQRSQGRLLAAPPLAYLAPPLETSPVPEISAKSAQAKGKAAVKKEKSPNQFSGPRTPPLEAYRWIPDDSSSTSDQSPAVEHKPSLPALSLDLSLGGAPAKTDTSSHCIPALKAPATTYPSGAEHKAARSETVPPTAGLSPGLGGSPGFQDHLSLQLAILFQEDNAVTAAAASAASGAAKSDAAQPDTAPIVHRPRPQYPTGARLMTIIDGLGGLR